MNNKTIKQIVENIEEIFVNEEKYEMRKSLEEVNDDSGDFLGDFIVFLMVDKNETPPTFYSVSGPFDVISEKAPQHALVWQNGKLLLNTDYTDHAAMRTGAMDSIALKLNNIRSLSDKKILIFGVGLTASWSLRVMKVMFEDLAQIDYINSTNTKSQEFESFAADLGVNASVGSKDNLSEYDVIICHTNAKQPVLDDSDLERIKTGAVITTYIGSEVDHGEVADEFYNQNANIVLDWDQNYEKAKGVKRSGTKMEDLILLKELLSGSKELSSNKNYTIYRFLGTPMQNLAVLQALVE